MLAVALSHIQSSKQKGIAPFPTLRNLCQKQQTKAK
jgi:hypothetical protein